MGRQRRAATHDDDELSWISSVCCGEELVPSGVGDHAEAQIAEGPETTFAPPSAVWPQSLCCQQLVLNQLIDCKFVVVLF